jgi:hypothetical protein
LLPERTGIALLESLYRVIRAGIERYAKKAKKAKKKMGVAFEWVIPVLSFEF